MAGTIKGITIQIEGKTSGLTKSLQEVETQIKKDDAALKNLNKALELDPTNVDLLAAKEAVLADKTEATAQKMEILQQVQADALSDLPDNAELTAAQMAELQAEIARTGSTLEELSGDAVDASGDMGEVGNAADETGQEVEESTSSFEGFGEAAEQAGEVASAAFDAVVAAAAAVGAAAVAAGAAIGAAMVSAGSAMVDATTSTAGLADELMTLSSTTGLSTDALQELNYAAELIDVDTNTVTGSMTKLLKQMSSAANGSTSAAAKFQELGIAFQNTDGSLRSSEDVFWDAIDVLGQIPNEAERDAAAMELFGRSARELNPLIEAGSATFAELAQEAHDVGYVMSSETLDAFGALDDNMVRMTNTAQAVEQSFGQVLLPLLTDMSGSAVSLMSDFSSAMAGAGGDISAIGGIIEEFAPQVVALVDQYAPEILDIIQSVINAILPALVAVAPQILSTLASIIVQLGQMISSNADAFISAFNELFSSAINTIISLIPVLVPLAVELVTTLATGLIDNIDLIIEGATLLFQELLNAICNPDTIAALVNGVIELVMSIVGVLTDEQNIVMIINAGISMVLALTNGLIEAIPTLIPAIVNAVITIVTTLTQPESMSMVLEAGIQLFISLVQSIIQAIPQIIAALPQIIMNIIEFLTGPGLVDLIQGGIQLFIGLVTSIPKAIIEIVKHLPEIIIAIVKGLVSGVGELAKAGLELIKGLWEGIKNAASWIWEKLKGFCSGIVDKIKGFFGIHSPSKVFAEIGDYCAEGLGEGFDDGMDSVAKEMANSAAAAVDEVEGALDPLSNVSAEGIDVATQSNVTQTVDYTGGLSRIESALVAQVASNAAAADGQTLVFPIYIGSEHVDTIVLDAVNRYNYTTGGH